MNESFVPTPYAQALSRRLWPQGPGGAEQVYAVLDGARDGRIYSILAEAEADSFCLIEGAPPYALARTAPYLVRLDPGSLFSRWLMEQTWDQSWGIFVASSANLKRLRSHLGQLLKAVDENGRRLHFRYYDPRVLAPYLPTCTAQELRRFFGPVQRILLPEEGPQRMIIFKHSETGLEEERSELGQRLYIQSAPPKRPRRLFAVLDAAQSPLIQAKLSASAIQRHSLFDADTPKILKQAGPYLVQLDTDEAFAAWVLNNGWDNNWGIGLASRAGLHELRDHLRRFLRAKEGPDSKAFYFRFYDPRVLQIYLPTCTPRELKRFFGPVERFLIPAKGASIRYYEFDGAELIARDFPPDTADKPLDALRAAVTE